jgi:outer membrane protein OmpA-like peptidoglycan-associated protein
MREERRQSVRRKIRLEVKRSTELWLYSFADMYMIISVLFIATTAIYAKKSKELDAQLARKETPKMMIVSALRGPATAQMAVAIEFAAGSSDITEESIEQLNLMLPLMSEVKSGVVDVEGYADSRGLASVSDYDSNLELSSERAVHVAQWFMKQGIAESRIRTTSFGRSYKLANGEKGAISDRRVVVKFYSAGS